MCYDKTMIRAKLLKNSDAKLQVFGEFKTMTAGLPIYLALDSLRRSFIWVDFFNTHIAMVGLFIVLGREDTLLKHS